MIIVSQDKTKIINFDNVTQVYTTFDEDDNYVWLRIETVDSLYEDLGFYKTEERAIEVLQEIIQRYIDCNDCFIATGWGYVKNSVYEMPMK